MHDDKGSFGPFFIIALIVLLGFLGFAVDLGYSFYNKQKLQSTADAVALSSVMDIDNYMTGADDALAKNGVDQTELSSYVVERGWWDPGTKTFTADPDGMAVRVYLQRTMPALFSRLFGRENYMPAAQAVANLEVAGTTVTLGTTLLTVDTNRAALLNSLLGGMLGTSVGLDAVSWQGIAAAQINLVKFLNLAKARFNIGDTNGLLNSRVSFLDIVDLALDALSPEDVTARAALNTLKTQVAPLTTTIRLGDLIQLDANDASLTRADVNLFELLRTSSDIFNYNSGVTSDIALNIPGLVSTDVKLKVLEPPVIAVAKEGTTLHSAQVRLFINAKVLSGLAGGSLLNLPLYAELGAGDAAVNTVGADSVGLTGTASASKMFLGSIDEGFFFSQETLDQSDFGPATILNVPLLAKVTAKSFVDAQGGSGSLTFTPPYPQTQSVYGLTGTTLASLVSSLMSNLDLQVQLLGLGLNLGLIANTLNNTLETVLTPLLSGVLDPVSTLLGVYPGRSDITVNGMVYDAKIVQ